MRLKPCSSCERLVHVGPACPFCGAEGVPSISAPHVAAVLLSLPLLASGACTRATEAIYGGPEMMSGPEEEQEDPASPTTTAAPEKPGATKPVPDKPAKADPPPPGEPQGEIYGTPEMMDSSADTPELPEPAPETPDEG